MPDVRRRWHLNFRPMLAALLAVTLIGAALAGGRIACRDQASGAGSDGPDEVRIGYLANVTHAQAVLGVSSGDFAAATAPVKLTAHVFNAGPSLIEALFAGEIDIGYVGPSPALNGHLKSRGKALRVVAGAAANGVVIVARPGSGITRLQDLRAKRIATPQLGNTQDISARHFLVKTLGEANAENVTPIPNSEQAAMMVRGQIDAAWAVEPWASRLITEAGATVIAEEKDLWPEGEFSLTVVVASTEFLEKHPDLVRSILGVHCAWTARLESDLDGQVPVLAAALGSLTGRRLFEAQVAGALGRVRFSIDPMEESLRTFARWPAELGMARGVPDVGTLVDARLLHEIDPCGAALPAKGAAR